jgi:hypothetical protein
MLYCLARIESLFGNNFVHTEYIVRTISTTYLMIRSKPKVEQKFFFLLFLLASDLENICLPVLITALSSSSRFCLPNVQRNKSRNNKNATHKHSTPFILKFTSFYNVFAELRMHSTSCLEESKYFIVFFLLHLDC